MPPGRQLGLLWGSVAAVLVAIAPAGDRWLAALPACPVRAGLDLPCPSCGTARAALALAGFDLPAALGANPLAALAWIGLVGGGLVAGAAALAGVRLPEPTWRPSLAARLAIGAALVLNWAYLILVDR